MSEPEQEPTWEGLGAEGYKNYHEGYTFSKQVLSVAALKKFVITFESGGYKKKVQVKKQFSLQAAAQVHLGRYLPVQKNNGKPEPFGATLDRFKALWLEVKGEEFLLSGETTKKQKQKNESKALEEKNARLQAQLDKMTVTLLETQTAAEEQKAKARKWRAQAEKNTKLATAARDAVSSCSVLSLCCAVRLCDCEVVLCGQGSCCSQSRVCDSVRVTA